MEEATGESQVGGFGSVGMLQEKSEPRWGCYQLTEKSEKTGLGDRIGVLLLIVPLVASPMESPRIFFLSMCWREGHKHAPRRVYLLTTLLKNIFIYLFLERRKRREKERERNINVWLSLVCPLLVTWPATQACVLTGNRTSIPL